MADLEFRFTVHELPDGKAVTSDELERLILGEPEGSGGTSKQALWNLAILYSQTGRQDRALDCVEKLMAIADHRVRSRTGQVVHETAGGAVAVTPSGSQDRVHR